MMKGLLHSQPVVRIHPVTGRKWLTINQTCKRFIGGLPPNEGDAILRMLMAHMQKPEFGFRHTWKEGDLLMWDQQAVQHYAVNDFEGRRLVHRIAVLRSAVTYKGVKTVWTKFPGRLRKLGAHASWAAKRSITRRSRSSEDGSC